MATTRATGDDASTTADDDDATEIHDHGFSTDGKNRAYAASMDADASRRRLGDARATYAMTIFRTTGRIIRGFNAKARTWRACNASSSGV